VEAEGFEQYKTIAERDIKYFKDKITRIEKESNEKNWEITTLKSNAITNETKIKDLTQDCEQASERVH
jgi:predicted  nucleic acid-binding Zn-ribbon protein